MNKIEFEIRLRANVTLFNRRCESAFKRITKKAAPRCFLTHWFYYQLTKPSETADVFIRDIESPRSQELLRELVIIASKNEANADFIVSAVINEAKAYLKRRACELTSASKSIEQPKSPEASSGEQPKSPEASSIEQPKSPEAPVRSHRKRINISDVSIPQDSTASIQDMIFGTSKRAELASRSLDFQAHVETDTPIKQMRDSLVYNRGAQNINVKATPQLIDRLKNMYKGSNFLVDAFCMLYRYETLNLIAKETMQLSAPDLEYRNLMQNGFQLECFASPINSHLKFYYSAFRDTDECFGSLGSFFELSDDFFDKDLKCTCDTPYQLDAIELNVDKVLSILAKYEGKHSLEFKFILPYWDDADYIQKLKDSKYTRSFETKENYSYVLHKASTDEKKSIVPCVTLRCSLGC